MITELTPDKKKIFVVEDDSCEGPFILGRRSLHQHLDAVLDSLEDGEEPSAELKITFHPMTQREIDMLPVI